MRGKTLAVLMLMAGCQTVPTPEQERAWQEKQVRNRAELAARREADAKAKAEKEAAEKAEKERKLAEVEKFFAAKCAPDSEARTRGESISCGDLLKLKGKDVEAITRWREALKDAAVKGELCAPALRIKRFSVQPERDLGDTSPSVVGECQSALKVADECMGSARQIELLCEAAQNPNCRGEYDTQMKKCEDLRHNLGWWYAYRNVDPN